MWCVDWYVHLSEDGDNLSQHMQQGMENWVGLLKQITTARIKPNHNWLERLARYLDLYVIGGLRENIVDFKFAKEQFTSEMNLIWNDGVTPKTLSSLEEQMPPHFRTILNMIDKIEFGRDNTIPAALYGFAVRSKNEKLSEQALRDGIDEFVRLTMIDGEDEQTISQNELNKRISKHLKRKRQTKSQMMANYSGMYEQSYTDAFGIYAVSSREEVSTT